MKIGWTGQAEQGRRAGKAGRAGWAGWARPVKMLAHLKMNILFQLSIADEYSFLSIAGSQISPPSPKKRLLKYYPEAF